VVLRDEQAAEALDRAVAAEPTRQMVAAEQTRVTFLYQQDAPSCHECGSIMVRTGSCYKCHNCGSTSGCS
jgi:ribonucleoside-diphosphate reductase alpha chain